jgi:DNA protecting protein DprA
MSLRDELLRVGVPETAPEGALDVARVERNIDMALPSRMSVTSAGENVVFESLVGRKRRIEIPARRLWDPSQGRPLTAEELREELAPVRRTKDAVSDEELAEARTSGDAPGVELDVLAALFLVESIRGFGPQKFKELYDANLTPADVLERPQDLPTSGKRGDQFRVALTRLSSEDADLARRRAARQIIRARENKAKILTLDHPSYPANVRESNNPVPILYVRGSLDLLAERRAVACVGSRQIRPPYDQLHDEFARAAVAERFTVVSGFAVGADAIGHLAAYEAGGATIAVMPCGLDRPFPPENRGLWERLLAYPGAAFVSEFPFGTAAAALTLRKRNKLIVAFARGVLVSQSSAKGGAMNAFRFALEQRRPVVSFASDGQPDSSGNELIAEPDQKSLPNGGARLFPREPAPEEWRRWLQELSSLT